MDGEEETEWLGRGIGTEKEDGRRTGTFQKGMQWMCTGGDLIGCIWGHILKEPQGHTSTAWILTHTHQKNNKTQQISTHKDPPVHYTIVQLLLNLDLHWSDWYIQCQSTGVNWFSPSQRIWKFLTFTLIVRYRYSFILNISKHNINTIKQQQKLSHWSWTRETKRRNRVQEKP